MPRVTVETNEYQPASGRFAARTGSVAATACCALLLTCVSGAGPAAASGRWPGAAGVARRAAPAGTISTVAGGVGGPGPATAVALAGPCGVAAGHGSTYIADSYFLRRVDPATGRLTTPAGEGADPAPDNNGGPATGTFLFAACTVALDHAGNPVINNGNSIQVVAARTGRFYGQQMTAGHIYPVAGDGRGLTRSGVPANSVGLSNVTGVAVGPHGNLLIADSSTQACGTCRSTPPSSMWWRSLPDGSTGRR